MGISVISWGGCLILNILDYSPENKPTFFALLIGLLELRTIAEIKIKIATHLTLDFLMQGFSTSRGRESIAEAFSLKAPSEFCMLANKSFVLAGISRTPQKKNTPISNFHKLYGQFHVIKQIIFQYQQQKLDDEKIKIGRQGINPKRKKPKK